MVYAEILAGGKGTRMNSADMPKQYLDISGKPIFIYTLEAFLSNPRVDKIIICCPKAWIEHTQKEIKKYVGDTNDIYVVEGGTTRNDTILNGCYFIKEKFGLNEEDIVLTHDAVRPFVSQTIINQNIDETFRYGAVDTVIEATDTIVHSVDHKFITDIPIRGEMYQGQTPQTFKVGMLIDFLESLNEDEKTILTDACKALVLKGYQVGLVPGEINNIKITTQYDLKIAKWLMQERIEKGNK